MNIDAIFTWVHGHGLEVAALGAVAAQLATLLPDGPFKTRLSNLLHGLFPSPQVVASGMVEKSAAPPAAPAVKS